MHRISITNNRRGMTLVEVMVATVIFTLLALGTTAAFIQNNRMITTLRYRTQMTNTALSIVEQLRLNQYTTIKDYHDSDAESIQVNLPDPTYVPKEGELGGYRPTALNINVLDGKIKENRDWTPVELFIENSATPTKVKAKFWTTINANISASTPVVEVYEIAVVYQWKNPGAAPSDPWLSSTIRLAVPNPNPRT